MDENTRTLLQVLLDPLFDSKLVESKYYENLKKKAKKGAMLLDNQWDKEHIDKIIEEIKSKQDNVQTKYLVIQENGVDVLIFQKCYKKSARYAKSSYRKVLSVEESFEVLSKVHRELGHKDFGQINARLRDKYHFPIGMAKAMVASCNVCEIINNLKFLKGDNKSELKYTKIKVWRVNLVNIPHNDCPFKNILLCEDVATDFLILRSLKQGDLNDIVDTMLKIFFEFGPPDKIAVSVTFEETMTTVLKIMKNKYSCYVVIANSQDSKTVIKHSDVIQTIEKCVNKIDIMKYRKWEIACLIAQRKLNTRLRIFYENKYMAFVPHNLFMAEEIEPCDWDEEIIIGSLPETAEEEKESGNRKRKMPN